MQEARGKSSQQLRRSRQDGYPYILRSYVSCRTISHSDMSTPNGVWEVVDRGEEGGRHIAVCRNFKFTINPRGG